MVSQGLCRGFMVLQRDVQDHDKGGGFVIGAGFYTGSKAAFKLKTIQHSFLGYDLESFKVGLSFRTGVVVTLLQGGAYRVL